MSITAKIETITPEKARGYLTDPIFNRGIVDSHVAFLSDQMKRGVWDENGETIKFDDRGRLFDGQHRMSAVIASGVPVKMLVVRGLDPKTFDTVDTGRPRYQRDILSIDGYDMADRFAGLLRYIHRWSTGMFPSPDMRQSRMTNADALTLAKKYQDAHDSLRWAYKQDRSTRIITAKATIAFAHWATTRGRPTIAKRFWAAYATGEGDRGSPAIALRNKFLYAFTTDNRSAKLKDYEVIATCAVAWRYELEGKPFSMLKWNPLSGWAQFIGCETPVPARGVRSRRKGRKAVDAAVAVA